MTIDRKCSGDPNVCRKQKACEIRQKARAISLDFKVPAEMPNFTFDARDCTKWYTLDSLEGRLAVYENRVTGWFLNVEEVLQPKGHYGFVVLQTAIGQLEGLHQYRTGRDSKNKSGEYFKAEMLVFLKNQPEFKSQKERTKIAKKIWNAVRNGFFHDGMTRVGVGLNPDLESTLCLTGDTLVINPYRFATAVRSHVQRFIEKIRTDPDSQKNFMNMWELKNTSQ